MTQPANKRSLQRLLDICLKPYLHAEKRLLKIRRELHLQLMDNLKKQRSTLLDLKIIKKVMGGK